jgi:hypothetical protein
MITLIIDLENAVTLEELLRLQGLRDQAQVIRVNHRKDGRLF